MSEQSKEVPGLLGPPVSYLDILDAAIIANKEKERASGQKYNPLRPSAAGKCARALAYEYNEFKGNASYPQEEVNPDLERLFSLGHAVEANMIQMFRRAEVFSVKYCQQALTFLKLSENEIIEGSNDLVLYFGEHRCLADWKTKGVKFSSYRESSWDEQADTLRSLESVQTINERLFWIDDLDAFIEECPDESLRDNALQINLYCLHEFMQDRKIDHGAIFMYQKNKSVLREIRFKPSLKARDYVLNKFKSVADAINSGQGPEVVEKEAVLGSFKCAFCRFKDQCWPEADTKKAFFKTLPEKHWARDTNRLGEIGEKLEELYTQLAGIDHRIGQRAQIEEKICMILNSAKVNKVKFSDGSIYEMKFLKSPRPHYELRRSKV